jgi:hypothetical protein
MNTRQQLIAEIDGQSFVQKLYQQGNQQWIHQPAGFLEQPPLEIKRSASLYSSVRQGEFWTFTQNDRGAASFCLSGTQQAKDGFVIQFASPVSDVNGVYVIMAAGELRVLRAETPMVRSGSNAGQFTFRDLLEEPFDQPALPTGNTYLWFTYDYGTITIGTGSTIGNGSTVLFKYTDSKPLGGVMSYGFGLVGEPSADDSVFISDVVRVGL